MIPPYMVHFGTGTKFLIAIFLITKFLITNFLIYKAPNVTKKVPNVMNFPIQKMLNSYVFKDFLIEK